MSSDSVIDNPPNSYLFDSSIYIFLGTFENRDKFCDYRCPGWWDFPCHMLYECNLYLRNILIFIILPLLITILIVVCCSRDKWTLPCWIRYLGVFTGAALVFWIVKKIKKIHKKRMREKRKQMAKQNT